MNKSITPSHYLANSMVKFHDCLVTQNIKHSITFYCFFFQVSRCLLVLGSLQGIPTMPSTLIPWWPRSNTNKLRCMHEKPSVLQSCKKVLICTGMRALLMIWWKIYHWIFQIGGIPENWVFEAGWSTGQFFSQPLH